MRVSYSAGYTIPLPKGHRFPMRKFGALYEQLLAAGLIRRQDVVEPNAATLEDLALVHSESYLVALANARLDKRAERRLGLPATPALWRRSRLAVQGTVNAARFALEDGIAANLAGGTHHAFAEWGEGFCVLNDIAVAIRVLRREGLLRRALVVDLDVHQGNGTANIFEDDPLTYTFSMHGANNFPFAKERSSLDVPLEDQIGDAGYLVTLDEHLPAVFQAADADIVFYLAGVDVVEGDRFGRLDLSEEGLARRDRTVLRAGSRSGIPLVVLMSGGYAESPERTADLHATVHREAREIYGSPIGTATRRSASQPKLEKTQ